MRRSSSSTMPIWTPRFRVRSPASIAIPARPAFAPIVCWCRPACTTSSPKKLTDAVGKLRVGDGLAGVTDQGPLIDAKAVAKVEEHIADAVAKGASRRAGRQAPRAGRHFLRTHDPDAGDAQDAGGPRRNLRPGGAAVQVPNGGRGDRHGQRHRVRLGRVRIHARSGAKLAGIRSRSNTGSWD